MSRGRRRFARVTSTVAALHRCPRNEREGLSGRGRRRDGGRAIGSRGEDRRGVRAARQDGRAASAGSRHGPAVRVELALPAVRVSRVYASY